jgi:putative transposase
MEDLNIKGMMKNRKLAKAISDVGWGALRRQVEYKADWQQKRVVFVDRFFPSSKRCSECHEVKQDLTLSDRTYHCTACGFEVDRDMNGAFNLEQEGRRLLAA